MTNFNFKFLGAWLVIVASITGLQAQNDFTLKGKDEMVPAGVWNDVNGEYINAHGGGILLFDSKYYWFGEHRPAKGFSTEVGVTCYSSTDLCNWRYEGVALSVSEEAGNEIEKGCIMERPKVIYNKRTKKFVMWFHLELKGKGYEAARAGVAVSDSPTGPYRFVSSSRVCPGIFPLNMTEEERDMQWNMEQFEEWWTPEWREAVNKGLFVKRDLEGGQMSRDMTLYVDDDGIAYHIYSSEENLTLQIAELTDDYQGHSGKYVRLFPGGHNEAPAIFKKDGTYWMITSGCTASTQYGYAEMLRAATDGELDFAADVREYARRAERMKKIFTDNGFHIVYDYDVTRPVGDGFFFTVGYGRMSGGELLRELLYYGVSSISLETTGSGQPGVRACTSRMREELYPLMEERMKAFRLDHPLS